MLSCSLTECSCLRDVESSNLIEDGKVWYQIRGIEVVETGKSSRNGSNCS